MPSLFKRALISATLLAAFGTFSCSHLTSDSRNDLPPKGLLPVGGLDSARNADSSEKSDDSGLPLVNATYSLEECIAKALELNRKRPASRAAVAVAEAQHQQALAAYWPQLTLQGNVNLRSDDPNFVFPAQDFILPETSLAVPAQQFMTPATTFTTPPTTITTPATSITTAASTMTLPLGPGGAPVPVPVPAQTVSVPSQNISVPSQNISVPSQTINVPGGEFTVPSQTFHLEKQDVKQLDRFTYGTNLGAEWLLWDGGWRKALNDQAKAGIAAAMEDARRTDLEIVYDVQRLYAGLVLATGIEDIARDTLGRMEASLELTERLYQGESMQVKKTDYLRNKVLVEGLRSMMARLEQNRRLAAAALVNSMGLSWRSEIRPKDRMLGFEPVRGTLDQLVADSYELSPDWRQMEIGLGAAEAKIREEKSGRMPRVAFVGNIHAVENSFEGGVATDSNLNAWNVGVGVEVPLFQGFLTEAKIKEAKARLDELKHQKVLLREGLALHIKTLLIRLDSMRKQDLNNRAAVATASENRELTEKSYRNDLIEADKVFTAQITEAIVEARQWKLRFDHAVTKSQLDLVVGRDVLGRLGLGDADSPFVPK